MIYSHTLQSVKINIMSNVDILQEIDFGTITIDLEINFEYLDIKVVCFLPLVIDHNPD